MTLFKQMALMLSIFLYVILTIVLFLNFQSAKNSVKDRLYDDAKNTATSLSLSLGGANGDLAMMSTMINANFDSGNYNKITLIDVDGNALYERENGTEDRSVAKWFLELIDIEAPIAFANVSAGWNQVGILNVVGDATYAHKQLYNIFIDLVLLFISVTLIGLVVLNYLIHTILKPLKEIQKQAAALIRNEFIIQTNTPYIVEFKDVVIGMNNMVVKVKAMFDKGNRELKALKEHEYIDKDTQLKNKTYFIDKLPEYLKVDASYKSGVNILISINGVVEANEKIGRVNVNKLFLSLIDIFKNCVQDFNEAMIIRMGGVEFSLFIPNCTLDNALNIAKRVQQDSYSEIKKVNLDTKETLLYFGLYEYFHLNPISEFLAASDDSLSQSKFYDSRMYAQKSQESLEIMGRDEWRETILKAIEKNMFDFVFWSVLDTKNEKTIYEVLSIKLTYNNEKSFSYAQFMAHVIQSGLTFSVYKNILNMIFTKQNLFKNGYVYSIRLPKEYLKHKEAYTQFSQLLGAYAAKMGFKLIVELPDTLVREDSRQIRDFIELFKKYNIDIGVFEFIGEGEDYQYIQNLRPVYIKAECSYFLSQSQNSLSALRLISDTIGISLIAVGVADLEMLEELKQKDIDKVQGYVTELISKK